MKRRILASVLALAMVLSMVIVPVVSLVSPHVGFSIKPPSGEGAIDREYEHELESAK